MRSVFGTLFKQVMRRALVRLIVDGTGSRDHGTGAIVGSELAEDVFHSEISQSLCEVLFACVMTHQDDRKKSESSYISVTAPAQYLERPLRVPV